MSPFFLALPHHASGQPAEVSGPRGQPAGQVVVGKCRTDLVPDGQEERLVERCKRVTHVAHDHQYTPNVFTVQDGKRKAVIRMTLTAPGCGMGDILVADARAKLLEIPGVAAADVQLVFDPPWTQDKMSEAARLQAGLM
jgi:hypothetical protein